MYDGSMKLYSAALSLFARKVEVVLGEKNLAFERVMVPFSQSRGYSPKHPDVLGINPKGQVPVLIDQGLKLYDSTVIVEYLEDAYPEPALFPSTPGARAQCRQFELFTDEVFLVPVRALMHRTGPRPADPQRWTEMEAQRSKPYSVSAPASSSWISSSRTRHFCAVASAWRTSPCSCRCCTASALGVLPCCRTRHWASGTAGYASAPHLPAWWPR